MAKQRKTRKNIKQKTRKTRTKLKQTRKYRKIVKYGGNSNDVNDLNSKAIALHNCLKKLDINSLRRNIFKILDIIENSEIKYSDESGDIFFYIYNENIYRKNSEGTLEKLESKKIDDYIIFVNDYDEVIYLYTYNYGTKKFEKLTTIKDINYYVIEGDHARKIYHYSKTKEVLTYIGILKELEMTDELGKFYDTTNIYYIEEDGTEQQPLETLYALDIENGEYINIGSMITISNNKKYYSKYTENANEPDKFFDVENSEIEIKIKEKIEDFTDEDKENICRSTLVCFDSTKKNIVESTLTSKDNQL